MDKTDKCRPTKRTTATGRQMYYHKTTQTNLYDIVNGVETASFDVQSVDEKHEQDSSLFQLLAQRIFGFDAILQSGSHVTVQNTREFRIRN